MYSLFDHMAQNDDGKRVAGRQAAAVAQKRVSDTVGGYLKIAKTPEEYEARLDFVSEDIKRIVADVAEEYNADVEDLQDAIDEHLKGEGITDLDRELEEAPSAVGHKAAGGHKPGCECGFCENKGKLPGSDSEDDESEESEVKESATCVAEAPRDGGGATKTMDMPAAKGDRVGYEPEPKTDHRKWKPNALNDSTNTPPVDTEMSGSPVPTKEQDVVDDTPDYEGDFLRDTDAVTESQELPSANDSGQSTERNVSQEGQGGTWTEAQNDPVTASTDPDANPLKAILENGFVADNTVESAIHEFEAEKD